MLSLVVIVFLNGRYQRDLFDSDGIDRLVNDLYSKGQHEIVAAVFLTDVEGLYDRPPDASAKNSTDSPKLIRQIYVTPHGEVSFLFSNSLHTEYSHRHVGLDSPSCGFHFKLVP